MFWWAPPVLFLQNILKPGFHLWHKYKFHNIVIWDRYTIFNLFVCVIWSTKLVFWSIATSDFLSCPWISEKFMYNYHGYFIEINSTLFSKWGLKQNAVNTKQLLKIIAVKWKPFCRSMKKWWTVVSWVFFSSSYWIWLWVMLIISASYS